MKKLELTIDNKQYDLAMNRDSIKWLEANGFVPNDFVTKPLTCYELLWQSLFFKNYRSMSINKVLELMEKYKEEGNSVLEVVKFAFDEYNAFIDALVDMKSKKTGNLKITEE